MYFSKQTFTLINEEEFYALNSGTKKHDTTHSFLSVLIDNKRDTIKISYYLRFVTMIFYINDAIITRSCMVDPQT